MDPNEQPDNARSDLPSLPARLFQVVVSPGKLTEQLARDPRWALALLLSVGLGALAVSLIPIDLMIEAQRQAALERGVEFPAMSGRALTAMRVGIPVATLVTTPIFAVLIAGFYAVAFAFILGDEGRFKQYLAVVAHAWFIPFLFSLLITPLRISTGDPQLTLNLTEIVVHEADQPDFVADLFDADLLAGEHGA
jgi:hypothetical protein